MPDVRRRPLPAGARADCVPDAGRGDPARGEAERREAGGELRWTALLGEDHTAQVAGDGGSESLTTFHSFRFPLILVFLIRSASARVSNTLAAGR